MQNKRYFIDIHNKTRYCANTPLECIHKIANNTKNHNKISKVIIGIRETTRNSNKNLYFYEVVYDLSKVTVHSVTREYKQKIKNKLMTVFSNFDNNLYSTSQTVIISKKDLIDLKEYLHHKKTKYTINRYY